MVPRRAMPAQDSSVQPGNPGILIVDDEPSVLSFLQRGLSLNGFSIWVAGDGKDAVEIYKTHGKSIAVVLMDVRMPGLDSPPALAALRSINPDVRCCFMSGGSGEYSIDDLLAGGAIEVFRKPFALSEAVGVLQPIVNEYKN